MVGNGRDFLLQGMEEPIHLPVFISWKICYLLGAWISDPLEGLLMFILPSDCYFWLPTQMGTNSTTKGDLEQIEE